jgi:hypothetical protein
MPRRSGPDKKQLIILLRTDLLAELYLLRPELQRADGHTRYGAISGYFDRLVREDLEKRKKELQAVSQDDPV